MENWTVRVYFSNTYSDVTITARTHDDARRIAEATYAGHRIGNIARVR